MKGKIGLYFQLETVDRGTSLSMVRLALDRLEQLERNHVDVEYFELRLSQNGKHKHAQIKLDGQGHTFIHSGTAFRWDEAFTDTFDLIQDQFKVPNDPVLTENPLQKMLLLEA